MAPEIVRDGWSATRERGAIVLRHRERGEVVLLGLAARLFDLADGRRDVAELAALLEAVPEDIFAALDELADHDLLFARVAPPAAVRDRTRREVLGALVGLAGLAVPGPVSAAPVSEAREAATRPAAAPTIAEQEAKLVTAAPPHEQVHKENTHKGEQQRKLGSAGARELALAVTAADNKQAEADLLLVFAEAAERLDSPAEAEEKRRLEVPPGLVAARESERKRLVAPLKTEEQAAKVAVPLHERRLGDEALALSAREQQSKLSGAFGVAQEDTHKALVRAREEGRKQTGERVEAQLRRARDARWRSDIVEARAEEQHDKDVARAHQLQRDGQAGEPQTRHAEEQRDKHRTARREQFQQRVAEQAHKRQTLQLAARTSQQAEQDQKQRLGEESEKQSEVRADLEFRRHTARSKTSLQ